MIRLWLLFILCLISESVTASYSFVSMVSGKPIHKLVPRFKNYVRVVSGDSIVDNCDVKILDDYGCGKAYYSNEHRAFVLYSVCASTSFIIKNLTTNQSDTLKLVALSSMQPQLGFYGANGKKITIQDTLDREAEIYCKVEDSIINDQCPDAFVYMPWSALKIKKADGKYCYVETNLLILRRRTGTYIIPMGMQDMSCSQDSKGFSPMMDFCSQFEDYVPKSAYVEVLITLRGCVYRDIRDESDTRSACMGMAYETHFILKL